LEWSAAVVGKENDKSETDGKQTSRTSKENGSHLLTPNSPETGLYRSFLAFPANYSIRES
jgi:hypothetical protein